jgi:putative transposase
MPRRARVLLPGVPLQLMQRGNSHSAYCFAEEDYLLYLERLADQARTHDRAIWRMTNYVHLLLTPAKPESAGMLMKGLGQRYVLACYRYIEMNPVRAEMVEHPAQYRWASYRVNAPAEQSAPI